MINSNYILIANAAEWEIENAVLNLAARYAGSGFVNSVELYRYPDEGLFLLLFPNNPDFEHFQYFVNYLKYPEDVKYNADVRGYWTLTNKDKPLTAYSEKRVMLYVSAADKDYDNINAVTEDNQTFFMDFGGKITTVQENEKEFLETDLNLDDFVHRENLVRKVDETEETTLAQNKGCLGVGLMVLALSGVIRAIIK